MMKRFLSIVLVLLLFVGAGAEITDYYSDLL